MVSGHSVYMMDDTAHFPNYQINSTNVYIKMVEFGRPDSLSCF